MHGRNDLVDAVWGMRFCKVWSSEEVWFEGWMIWAMVSGGCGLGNVALGRRNLWGVMWHRGVVCGDAVRVAC